MGDNAKKSWEWHNTVVGEGYQAKGVIRQPTSREPPKNVMVDVRKGTEKNNDNLQMPRSENVSISSAIVPSSDTNKRSRHNEGTKNKSKKHKRHKYDSDSTDEVQRKKGKKGKFNPLLQAFSAKLRDNMQVAV